MNASVIDFQDARRRAGDYMVRGTAADGMVRAFALTARDTVQTARENHGCSPVVTAALGRLMMGALMTGMMFKEPDELITFVVRGDGPIGSLTVTANCDGQVKGFPANPDVWLPLNDRGKLDVGGAIGAGTLSAVRDIPGEEPYSSLVELVSGEIGDDLAHYFMTSDQIPTAVGVGVLVGTDANVDCAGGFIIQLMPGCPEKVADAIDANLSGITSVTELLSQGKSPDDLLGVVLSGLDYHELEWQHVEFYCGCDEERVSRTLLALGEDELRDMIARDETAEVYCHFCGQRHYVPAAQLQELLDGAET